jgi:hypothetical protein
MPTSMKELDRTYRRNYRRLFAGIVVIYTVALLAVLSLLVSNPKFATWISEAAQAEFVDANPPSASEPTRLAQPAQPLRTVKAD